jgi:threonine synthase
MLQLADAGELPRGATVVCTLTGHGLKEPDWAIAGAGKPDVLPVDVAAVAAKLGLR